MHIDAPFVSQLAFGHNSNTNDPTGCWYASACMLNYAFEYGPRLGVPELYTRPVTNVDGTAGIGHWGLAQGWLETFMKRERLVALEGGMPKDPKSLGEEIKKRGPLLIFWFKTANGNTYGHASVVIGIADKKDVIFHDPENAPHSRMPIASLVKKLYPHDSYPTLRADRPEFSYMAAQKD